MNTCYKHYYYFVTEFKLVDQKEFEPLVSHCIMHTYVRMYVYA